jgi:xanthine dehydrogenase small subunit
MYALGMTASSHPNPDSRPLRFYRRGQVVTLNDVPADRTLLDVLREDLQCTGTKEGCGEGDCGACTVVVGEERDGKLHTSAINSCIRLAHSIDGMALWTVEDIGQGPTTLHPAQEAMVQCHGSQCGFCTPGFVMSLFALYRQSGGKPVSRDVAMEALSGNLCRCTGYRPIVDAATSMHRHAPQHVDANAVLAALRKLATEPVQAEKAPLTQAGYFAPRTLKALLRARAAQPQAQLVAGCTDVGLWVTKMHMQFPQVIDTNRTSELRRIEHYPHHIAIGAAVSLTDAYDALVADRPQLRSFAQRFAGLPVRNSGTLGGNVANGSPIGDSMPLLIALGASIVLMAERKGVIVHRELALENLYTGYRKNAMASDEVLAWIKVPKATSTEFSRVYKVSKRFEDDISAVCLGISLQIDGGRVASASIGAGGVAATPVRARAAEKVLRGAPWNLSTVERAASALQAEFQPISDMRASAGYRKQVLGSLLQRFWLESQGTANTQLANLSIAGEPA